MTNYEKLEALDQPVCHHCNCWLTEAETISGYCADCSYDLMEEYPNLEQEDV